MCVCGCVTRARDRKLGVADRREFCASLFSSGSSRLHCPAGLALEGWRGGRALTVLSDVQGTGKETPFNWEGLSWCFQHWHAEERDESQFALLLVVSYTSSSFSLSP